MLPFTVSQKGRMQAGLTVTISPFFFMVVTHARWVHPFCPDGSCPSVVVARELWYRKIKKFKSNSVLLEVVKKSR
jgi:hypothetical protein